MAKCSNPNCTNPNCGLDRELHEDIMAAMIKHLDADLLHSQEMTLTLAFAVLIQAANVAGVSPENVFQRGVVASNVLSQGEGSSGQAIDLNAVLELAKQKGISLADL